MDDFKVAIIDKEVKKIGDAKDEGCLHIQVLIDYIKENFSDYKIFDVLNTRHSPEIAAYLISRLGYPVFLNITKDVKKYGKTGIFIMPNKLDEDLKETIINFSSGIEDYSVTIFYDLEIIEGVLDAKNKTSMEFSSPSELLKSFFDKDKRK
ncbi:MAG: hypothetical protein PHQ64_04000 [Bacilli bacterium]|nr:hypothetical protein [Bacilli bacterium]